MVGNGVIWAGLSVAPGPACAGPGTVLEAARRPRQRLSRPRALPLRSASSRPRFLPPRLTDDASWLQTIGDLEVSFFMVALFVGILMANLQMRNEELTHALAEVHTLSGLLPICSWCKRSATTMATEAVEDYFASHSQIKFTHGICNDCFQKLHPHGHQEASRAREVSGRMRLASAHRRGRGRLRPTHWTLPGPERWAPGPGRR